MTRLPRVYAACRLFPATSLRIDRPAQLAVAVLTVGLGLALSLGSAAAQTKGSPEHIKAVTSAVDGASIRTNTAMSNDWPTIGLDYAETRFSKLHAIDARTGKKVWSFDPGVDREKGYKGCCDVVNRGVALWKGKVFVGAYDGRLIALDAASGQKVWEKDTITDHSRSYTVTGAPRVFNGQVVIGNGGAEYGVRGYVTAYDAET